MKESDKKFNKIFASLIVVVLIAFILYALLDFLKAFFAALILYTICRPIYHFFLRKGLGKTSSAVVVMLLSVLVVILPLFLLASLAAAEVANLASQKDLAVSTLQSVLVKIPGFDAPAFLEESLSTAGSYASSLVVGAVQRVGEIVIKLIVMFFVLFYLLVNDEKLMKKGKELIPFNKKNTDLLIDGFRNMTNSTIIVTGLTAAFQGALITVGFLFFKIPGAFLWGFIAAILSFIPVLGVFLIWVPIVVFGLATGNYFMGFGFLIWGLIVSSADNFIKPLLGKRIGGVHPLITLIGVFIGLRFFGLLGLIIGPLLLVYAILIIKMFKQEYLV